jgi:antitoxin (DNA-binding transcriptional repressor) of toxin-antitoxin stability system
VRHISLTIKTATVRDLGNRLPRVASWIAEGEAAEITKNGKPFARLLPLAPEKPRRFKMPDIMARLNQDFGESNYDGKDIARGLSANREDLSRPLTRHQFPVRLLCEAIEFARGQRQRRWEWHSPARKTSRRRRCFAGIDQFSKTRFDTFPRLCSLRFLPCNCLDIAKASGGGSSVMNRWSCAVKCLGQKGSARKVIRPPLIVRKVFFLPSQPVIIHSNFRTP